MEQPLLDVRHVEICYDGEPVVKDVSFQMQPGEILGIVGESGSGKSTLIRAAMGLLGRRGTVTRGDIYYRGQNVIDGKEKEIRKLRGPAMGMIFQNTQSALCPVRTIEDQLYESVQQHEKISRQEIRERAMHLFENMNLTDGERILKSYPFELSGGMNQRVGIAIAMLMEPPVLLADEPTSALDVVVQKQVIEEMLHLREMLGTAMILVTHDIGVVSAMADTVLVLQDGRIMEFGTARQVLHEPQNAYTRTLLAAVPKLWRT